MVSKNKFFKKKIKELQDKYWWFNFNLFRFDKKVNVLPVDFNKPWWKIIVDQKLPYLIVLFVMTIRVALSSLAPVIFTLIFTSGKLEYLFTYTGILLTFILFSNGTMYYYLILVSQCMYSISYNAHRYFLTVDPIFHTTRSSGKIIAKIDRATNSFEELLDIMTFEILDVIVKFITTIIILFSFNTHLGLIAATSFIIVSAISILGKLFITEGFEKYRIKDDDAVKAANLENLQSIQLIRSSFATIEQNTKLQNKHKNIMTTLSTLWIGHVSLNFLSRVILITSYVILGIAVLNLLNNGTISIALGLALTLTYINSGEQSIWIGNKISRLIQHKTRINDLFEFIRGFGKQTYPVLSKTENINIQPALKKEATSIIIKNLHLDYENQTKVFENHFLNLNVNKKQKSKLYGIIGPSGIGKTTFLSILGGQLKPNKGNAFINNIDIYEINDKKRKKIIAMQMQTASSLRGSLRYNLLFGLPRNIEDNEQTDIYSSSQLINVLKKVGLWNIFKEKKGLNTLIGEGGLNLSGGQRQRLNFASLYLRIKYFNPIVVLIDEPTSSLDEISEKAITNMISEIAEQSLTIVIAHRLKTLENSTAILDLSLLDFEKELKFYSHKELIKKSEYYKKLLSGELKLDS